jgi:ABC-type multidrug transport system fused ATPase/permease subunit
LKSKWVRYEKTQGRGDNALFKSILFAFWKDFLMLVILNIVSTLMGLCGPFIIKKLIDYIKTGKNPYDYEWDPVTAPYTDFDHHTEYGLMLVGILVLSQGLNYIISEHITYM